MLGLFKVFRPFRAVVCAGVECLSSLGFLVAEPP